MAELSAYQILIYITTLAILTLFVLGIVRIWQFAFDLFFDNDPFDWPEAEEGEQERCPRCHGEIIQCLDVQYCKAPKCGWIEKVKS